MIFVLFISVGAYANDKLVLTKEEAIDLALRQNAELVNLKKDLTIAQKKVKEAKASFYPQVDLSGRYTKGEREVMGTMTEYDAYSLGLGFQQPVYMGGQIMAGYKIQKNNLKLAQMNLDKKERELRYRITEQYYGVLKTRKMVEVSGQAVDKVARYLEIAKANQEVGIFTNTAVLQARINHTRAKQGLMKAENALKLSKMGLKNTLGLDFDTELELADKLEWEEKEIKEKEAIASALQNRVSLEELRMQEQNLKLRIEQIKGSKLPSLNLAGNYSSQDDSFFTIGDGDWSLTMAFNYTLFDGGKKDAGLEEAREQKNKLNISQRQLKDGVIMEVKTSLLKLDEARKDIDLAQLSLKDANSNLSDTELKYKEGIVTSFDVLDAQTTLEEVQTDYYQAIYNYNIALAKLRKVMGTKMP